MTILSMAYSYRVSIGNIQIDAAGRSGKYLLEVTITTAWGNRRTITKTYKTLLGIQKAVARWHRVAENAARLTKTASADEPIERDV